MTVTAGTGAGIGIALALLIVLVAGPGAYYYRKRRRDQLGQANTLEAGDDYFRGVKPQLDDTAVSPETAWRISRSTIGDGPITVSEADAAEKGPPDATALGISYMYPPIPRSGPTGSRSQELDISNEDRRPELSADIASPPPTELRGDKSPPVISGTERGTRPLADVPVESQEAFTRSDESIQFPTLPGPLLPPRDGRKSVQR